MLRAMVIWGVTLTVITELLSGLRLFTSLGVALAWLGVIGICALVISRYGWPSSWKGPAWRWSMPLWSSIVLAGVAWIVVITGVLAIASAPNNPDSMRYHMSRVMHWIQQATVAHYPTHYPEQLYQNPGSAFAIAQFQLLSGGDYFANLVQWGSMVMSLVGVSLIARQLGCEHRGQILAVVLCATIPMGVLQAASTQNDYVLSLWLVCFTYFMLRVFEVGVTVSTAVLLGSSLGLAILSKGTAYIYALPICLWLLQWTIQQKSWRIWKLFSLAGLITLSLNAGHYLRNLSLTGSPLGVDVSSETSQVFSIPAVIGSIAKHLSLHSDIVRYLGLQEWLPPTTGITHKLVILLHEALNLDVNDPQLISPSMREFYVTGISNRSEDTAGNPFHLLLNILALVLLIVLQPSTKRTKCRNYSLIMMGGFLLLCCLLTWSGWRSRLHLPFFVLFSPLTATVISHVFNKTIIIALSLFVFLATQPWLLNNYVKSLTSSENSIFSPRIEQYFFTRRNLFDGYHKTITQLETLGCQDIGIIMDQKIQYEYPLWVLMQERLTPMPRVRHVAVQNRSRKIIGDVVDMENSPCALISLKMEPRSKVPTDVKTEYGDYRETWGLAVAGDYATVQILQILETRQEQSSHQMVPLQMGVTSELYKTDSQHDGQLVIMLP
ncbi:hypothetical protein E1H12_16060 [Geitlerinema sp. P-1104]|uniref:ArnT family glycosyltransferase n=1 Tax=Geitlerinema sp. P-1104 TaxID=2546230 RepID=UPI0016A70979|nr:glycosyltransferase family 39 protein [Geitlerinema sp. P-1104]NMG59991.1 hypothetical protein [Geitlerinema sp. P-1104]